MTPFVEWLGTIPAGIWGALAGAVTARILTSLAERKRNRDAYRAPQREAIGAIIAAANDMKVSLSDALEHMGLTGRQTTDDAAVASLNTFLRRLLALDEQFSIGRLTVVDGPCRDKMLTAYVRFSELRKLANNPAMATQAGFDEFIREMSETSNALDTLLAELVDLGEGRLSPTRPLLSRRPTVKVASNKGRAELEATKVGRRRQNKGEKTNPSTPPAADAPAEDVIEKDELPPNPEAPPARERDVEVVGEHGSSVRIRTEVVKGAELTRQHVGRLVAEGRGSYNIMGRILDLTPVITDTSRSWLATIHWAPLPGKRPRVSQRPIRSDDLVELVEIVDGGSATDEED
ncbi:hypothetical protein MPRF_38990 [Mycolicibacterium parafortuitum]|uniref:Uncharacterized protein n=1 Tax=Mycolicibacterium parafortuitum TaxID=39692 RepID=A0A7I7U6T5_MYCPF|nr:hypothetical protein [Mycolicibacterium parafortuitum]BBY77000.1 hypothetical protein MPRF_38990 [Mycolicibacterium parafortuitum]